jgi:hypothetical protein
MEKRGVVCSQAQTAPHGTQMNILEFPPISRIRRNHGLEHATIHLLSRKYPHIGMAGHSDRGGFWLLGELETHVVESAVTEALGRMKKGEHGLAVHPNCGTNFVTSGTVTGLAGSFSMLGTGKKWQEKADRIPMAILLGTLALFVSRPLGFYLQRNVTTSGKPGDMEIVSIVKTTRMNNTAHRVTTQG